MRCNAMRYDGERGGAFTLIELLVVVVIVGIAAAIVVPHMLEPGTMRAQAAARALVADILFAQNDAIALQSQRRVVFALDENRYRLTDAGGTVLAAPSRTGGGYEVDFTRDRRFEGVTLTAAAFGDETVLTFDALGGPAAGGQVELTAGDTRYRVTVAAFTGRVTVAPLAASGD